MACDVLPVAMFCILPKKKRKSIRIVPHPWGTVFVPIRGCLNSAEKITFGIEFPGRRCWFWEITFRSARSSWHKCAQIRKTWNWHFHGRMYSLYLKVCMPVFDFFCFLGVLVGCCVVLVNSSPGQRSRIKLTLTLSWNCINTFGILILIGSLQQLPNVSLHDKICVPQCDCRILSTNSDALGRLTC